MEMGYFPTNTGLNVFYRYWTAREKEVSVILCIHGLAGDSRMFNYFGEKASGLGHAVYAIDMPGFGMSDGEKGDVPFDLTMQCLHSVVAEISKKHADEKIILLGFSLGALYVLWYVSMHPEKVLCATVLSSHLRIKGVRRNPLREPAKAILLKSIIRYFITPEKKINISKVVPNAFGELAGEEWIYMMSDSLCNFEYSYRYIFDVLIHRAERIDELYEIKLPLLILQGGKDLLPVPEQSRVFIDRIQSRDKELKIFYDADHWFYESFFYTQSKYTEAQRISVVLYIDAWVRTLKNAQTFIK